MNKEKAEAYDKLLVKAKQIYNKENDVLIIHTLEDLFPELKESEDEQSKKWILEYLYDGLRKSDEQFKGQFKAAIAWLEKQGTSYTKRDVDDAYVEGMAFAKNELEKQGGQIDSDVKDYNNIDPHFGKPIDKVEPFDKYEGLTDFERTLADICIGWIGEELGWKQYIKDNADVLLKIAVEKFNSVQDAPFEQKPTERSEEDERIRKGIIRNLEYLMDRAKGFVKDELSERIDWLESLRPQNTWKPSEEQMDALNHARWNAPFNIEILDSLYNDLKKLTE